MKNASSLGAAILLGLSAFVGTASADKGKSETSGSYFEIAMATNKKLIALIKETPSGEKAERADAVLAKLKKTNEQLLGFQKSSLEGRRSKDGRTYASLATELQFTTLFKGEDTSTQSDDPNAPVGSAPGFDGIDDVITIPPPTQTCKAEGDAVKADCLAGAQIRAECGLGNGPGPFPDFMCHQAGMNQTTACLVNAQWGEGPPPRPPSEAAAAQGACRAKAAKDASQNPAQTDTSDYTPGGGNIF